MGIIFALTGASGSGKTTYSKMLYHHYKNSSVLGTIYTTRKPRYENLDNCQFEFISLAKFEELIKHDLFACYTLFCDNYYGFSKENIKSSLAEGKDVILDSIMIPLDLKSIGNNVVVVYLTASTNKEMFDRIRTRNPDMDIFELEMRVSNFAVQLQLAKDCDYAVITDQNKTQETVFEEIKSIFNRTRTVKREGINSTQDDLSQWRIDNLILPTDSVSIL